jgi:hypothetical protein
VEGVEQRRDVVKLRGSTDKTNSSVLNSLEPIDDILRESGQQRVAIVKLGKDESTDKSFSCFSRENVRKKNV